MRSPTHRLFFISGCISLLICAAPLVCAQKVNVSANGTTTLHSHIGDSKAEVTIRTHEVPNGSPSSPAKPRDLPCTMSRFPCVVVDSLAFAVDGKSLFVPRSLVCDISDVLTAELKNRGNAWSLSLNGGDASESYSLNIEFDKSFIHRRTLFDGESGQRLQETIFYEPE
jgi:hypothetical protein